VRREAERPGIVVGVEAMALFRRSVAQLGDLAVVDDRARTHDRDVVADLLDLGHVMGAEQHRQAAGGEALDQRAHVAHAGGIEPVGRLVENEELRVAQQAGGDSEALAHAERVAPDLVVRAIGQIDELEHLFHPPRWHRRRAARARRGSCDR
jgi:hypothetical protein